jgi:hypothetical protein
MTPRGPKCPGFTDLLPVRCHPAYARPPTTGTACLQGVPMRSASLFLRFRSRSECVIAASMSAVLPVPGAAQL